MDYEFKAFALTLCGYSLAVLSYFLPWYYFIILEWGSYTSTDYLWFLYQGTTSLLFPQGPFVGGIFGLFVTIVLTSLWWKNKIRLSPSLAMLNLLILPWIFAPGLYFLMGFRPGIIIFGYSLLQHQGDLFGFPINLLSVISLGSAIACAILDEGFQKMKVAWNRVDIASTALISFCAVLVIISGILPWAPYPRPFVILPIAIGASLLAAAFLTRVQGVNAGLIIVLIWTGLELLWISGLWLHGIVPVWEISDSGFPFFYLFGISHDPMSLGPLLLFYTGFLILFLVCFLLWLTTIYKFKTFNGSHHN